VSKSDSCIVFVIFGAAVRPDGSASPTLARRTLGAWALSERFDARRFLVTGGQGRFGPPEAVVMRDLLVEHGVPEREIELEAESLDTLESARLCARLLRNRGGRPGDRQEVVIVTSRYHGFRCRLLLRMLGVEARIGRIPGEGRGMDSRSGLYYWLREVVAIPWDALLLLIFHRNER